MAGQSVERREVLRIFSLAAAASQFPGFKAWAFAHDHSSDEQHPHAIQKKPASQGEAYRPQFFTPEEYALVVRLTELIIPTDDTPGARAAGVSEFVDFMAASDPPLQPRFRRGLTWMNAHAIKLYGARFLELDGERANEMLSHLAYKDRQRLGEEDGQAFFRLMREYTLMGFYTSRVGMQVLDVPALKQYYAASPACPHTDNREHLDLKPKY
ncbi:MAG TPA: gluconate 2-dehydrogenase subunit 3 family protein [Blastocatellia bacterium]|nr:gluconate 2-dehydrogenase subunit 3 family protein [Blastocatellia bacterium]